jgi:hypothetical protein
MDGEVPPALEPTFTSYVPDEETPYHATDAPGGDHQDRATASAARHRVLAASIVGGIGSVREALMPLRARS